ncbi:hypothetical protein [Cohnella cellulosilytica]|uniref:Uncharacterized protein n=1 Tax=Cohnella cellulosilytica TaxID=986710 RepID=A0ABW2FNC6_9BACL
MITKLKERVRNLTTLSVMFRYHYPDRVVDHQIATEVEFKDDLMTFANPNKTLQLRDEDITHEERRVIIKTHDGQIPVDVIIRYLPAP